MCACVCIQTISRTAPRTGARALSPKPFVSRARARTFVATPNKGWIEGEEDGVVGALTYTLAHKETSPFLAIRLRANQQTNTGGAAFVSLHLLLLLCSSPSRSLLGEEREARRVVVVCIRTADFTPWFHTFAKFSLLYHCSFKA